MLYTDVMLDIETAGIKPGCALIAISAVPFNINTGAISKNTFFMPINLDLQIKNGFNYDQATIKWWLKEDEKLFNKLSRSTNRYVEVGKEFQKWFKSLKNNEDIRLWGNSNRFDIGILHGFYSKSIGYQFQPFWNTWNERDVRTLASLAPSIKSNAKFNGIKHNPLDDCIHQIKYSREIINKLGLKIH